MDNKYSAGNLNQDDQEDNNQFPHDEQNPNFANLIGRMINEQSAQEKLKKKVLNYVTDVLGDGPPKKQVLSPFAQILNGVKERGPPEQVSLQIPPEKGSQPQAASVFNKKHGYIPEFYAPPAQQVRHATEEDIERLRRSMDESTNKLTPKQMAFWERLSSISKDASKGKSNSSNMNLNQVLVKYDSVPPEQLLFFDPSKSVNLMVPDGDPDNSGFKLY